MQFFEFDLSDFKRFKSTYNDINEMIEKNDITPNIIGMFCLPEIK